MFSRFFIILILTPRVEEEEQNLPTFDAREETCDWYVIAGEAPPPFVFQFAFSSLSVITGYDTSTGETLYCYMPNK